MKNQNNQNNQNKANNKAKNCGNKNCGKNKTEGENHNFQHGGNND